MNFEFCIRLCSLIPWILQFSTPLDRVTSRCKNVQNKFQDFITINCNIFSFEDIKLLFLLFELTFSFSVPWNQTFDPSKPSSQFFMGPYESSSKSNEGKSFQDCRVRSWHSFSQKKTSWLIRHWAHDIVCLIRDGSWNFVWCVCSSTARYACANYPHIKSYIYYYKSIK